MAIFSMAGWQNPVKTQKPYFAPLLCPHWQYTDHTKEFVAGALISVKDSFNGLPLYIG